MVRKKLQLIIWGTVILIIATIMISFNSNQHKSKNLPEKTIIEKPIIDSPIDSLKPDSVVKELDFYEFFKPDKAIYVYIRYYIPFKQAPDTFIFARDINGNLVDIEYKNKTEYFKELLAQQANDVYISTKNEMIDSMNYISEYGK